MNIRKCRGIVLKKKTSGDTSLIVHVFTEDGEKVVLVAKGARSLKSRWRGSLEQFMSLDLQYYEKKDRPWQLLAGAEILENFRGISSDPESLIYGSIILEILDKSQLERGDPMIYKLVLLVFRHMDQHSIHPRYLQWYFIFIFLKLNGFGLNTDACSHCGRPLENAVFSARDASLTCESCQPPADSSYNLDQESLQFLRHMEINRIPGLANISMDESYMLRFDTVLRHALAVHFDSLRSMNSVKLLNMLDQG